MASKDNAILFGFGAYFQGLFSEQTNFAEVTESNFNPWIKSMLLNGMMPFSANI
jgi:hypothetical protein